jgi:hypothetical protein
VHTKVPNARQSKNLPEKNGNTLACSSIRGTNPQYLDQKALLIELQHPQGWQLTCKK